MLLIFNAVLIVCQIHSGDARFMPLSSLIKGPAFLCYKLLGANEFLIESYLR